MDINCDLLGDLSTPLPVLEGWFTEIVTIGRAHRPMPFRKLEHIVRRLERTAVKENFSAASVNKLKAQANDQMSGRARAMATTSSLIQAVPAHFWRAVCRAWYLGLRRQRLGVRQSGGHRRRDRVEGAGLDLDGVAAEPRPVASFDEATMRESMERWVREPDFTYMDNCNIGILEHRGFECLSLIILF
jgi:hypothetical protein